ncbi:hypothetical protein CK218_27695 [Mesorhizobium sp. WSM3879]|uniref:hypothetical protein n=1 Tax=Mesorhizobium sp. WSM3879 TaxID=2029406 RepID=UPI000BAF0353|nr:hypothetical protein [Mesorhizobium sp. WSM3879]PBB77890.1 hypothetical protein CK218_27695 [Mesorhizobium sp. WSM3879]
MRPVVKLNKDGSERLMLGDVILKEKPAHKTTKPFSIQLLRLREVEKVIKDRHGGMIPDPEDTDDRETCLNYVKAAAFSPSAQDMFNWCRKWAPWVLDAELTDILAQASRHSRMMTADGVAGLLAVTMAERDRLRLKTIGACDISKEERANLAKERKRDRDRSKKAEGRKARGCKDRESYEAESAEHLEPWNAEGISRRTWFYRKARTDCTSPSRVDVPRNGDTPVQRDAKTDGDPVVSSKPAA